MNKRKTKILEKMPLRWGFLKGENAILPKTVCVQRIDQHTLQAICHEGQILVNAKRGPKVMENNQQEIVKFFVPRKWLSSTQLWPYAIRFAKNARRLLSIGVDTVDVQKIMYCKERQTYLVVYPKIPGEEVRTVVKAQEKEIMDKVCQALAALHQKGVFFKGIHLGNLLLTENGQICLLDIANLKIFSHSLSLWHRSRNIRHLLRCRDDKDIYESYGVNNFLEDYFSYAKLRETPKKWLKFLILRGKSG